MKDNNTICNIKGLVVAGPAETKNEVMLHDIFQQYFSEKVLQVTSSTEINDRTVYEVYDTCLDNLLCREDNNKIMEEFDNLLRLADDRLVFGEDVFIGLKKKIIEKNSYW